MSDSQARLDAIRERTNALYRSLDKIGDGDWTPQDQHASLVAADAIWLLAELERVTAALDALCGEPCPEAPDLLPCLLERDHGGDWHRNRSTSWPTDAWLEAGGEA